METFWKILYIVIIVLLLGFGVGTIWCYSKYITKEKHGLGMIFVMFFLAFVSFAVCGYLAFHTKKKLVS